MRIALDKFGQRVHIDDTDREETYYCPGCGEKMVQRHGKILSHCFAHFPNSKCTDSWHYDESEWHVWFQSLFPKDNQEVTLELDGKKHRADILYEERKTVIEIQGDRLTQSEFKARNEFFNALGFRVIWIFDESRIFENESITIGSRRKACNRVWDRPSRIFQDLRPQWNSGVEVWFQRSHEDSNDEPCFFQVLESSDSFKRIACGFCHTLKEMMRYLKTGERTPDYTNVFDIKYAVRRTDKSLSVYRCPKTPDEPFAKYDACMGCPFCEEISNHRHPLFIECSYRLEESNWEIFNSISSIKRREDGFVESFSLLNGSGEIKQITLQNPKTFLMPIKTLLDKYKPSRDMLVFNARTKELYSIFILAYQVQAKGSVWGKLCGSSGQPLSPKVIEIRDAEKPVWFVISYE